MIQKIFRKMGVTDRASFWNLFWQFFKFGLVGLSNTDVYKRQILMRPRNAYLI